MPITLKEAIILPYEVSACQEPPDVHLKETCLLQAPFMVANDASEADEATSWWSEHVQTEKNARIFMPPEASNNHLFA